MTASLVKYSSLQIAVIAAFFASPVRILAEPTHSQTVTDVCIAVPAIDEDSLRPFLEMVLKPGERIELNKIPPEAMAKLATLQKQATERQATDWANLCRYAAGNAKAHQGGKPQRVVFLGDSITEYWRQGDPAFFSDTVQDRGISGQTTAQILLRFYPDVIALKPRVVHIMAGTNDVAGNLAPVSDDTIIANITAMLDMAKANHIKVVLASIPPARFMGWKPGLSPAHRIALLNQRLRQLAGERGAVYLDYHSRLRDDQGGFQAALANDGVHPNRDGYAIMRPMAERAIAQSEHRKY
jgi:lysophospholipase L1-like esterase